MSKRVSNKKSPRRAGVTQGRQRVRLGWRKRRARAFRIFLQQQNRDALSRALLSGSVPVEVLNG